MILLFDCKQVIELFEAQANKTPNNVALQYESEDNSVQTMTYDVLLAEVNQLACYLLNMRNIAPASFIGVSFLKTY